MAANLVERQIKDALKAAFALKVTDTTFAAVSFTGRDSEVNRRAVPSNFGDAYLTVGFFDAKSVQDGGPGYRSRTLEVSIMIETKVAGTNDTYSTNDLETALDDAELDANNVIMDKAAAWWTTVGEMAEPGESWKETSDSFNGPDGWTLLRYTIHYDLKCGDLETAF